MSLSVHFRPCLYLLLAAWTIANTSCASVLIRRGVELLLDDKPVRLVGYGDYGTLSERDFEYEMFFERLAQNRINFTRVWVNYHWTQSLSPYSRRSNGKYDLEAPSSAFYERLHSFVRYAESKGVVVQICLFDANGQESDGCKLRWARSPFNRANNVNGYLDSPGDYDDLQTPVWDKVHAPMVDRVVDTVGGFGNVIYEICNEPDTSDPGISLAFQEAVASRLRQRLGALTGSKLISVNLGRLWREDKSLDLSSEYNRWANTSPDVDVISIHVSQNGNTPIAGYRAVDKPVIISNDGDRTQQTDKQPGSSITCAGATRGWNENDRLLMTGNMLSIAFNEEILGAPGGQGHVEFLDKGLMDSSWITLDYNPRVSMVNENVLKLLSTFKPTALHFGAVAIIGLPVVYVDASNPGGEDGSEVRPFNTIAEGYAAAADGAELVIGSGEYQENVSFTKRMTVTGRKGNVVIR